MGAADALSRSRRGPTRIAISAGCAALLVGCGAGVPSIHPVTVPSMPASSLVPSAGATTPPTPALAQPKSGSGPDALGARRVIPVPKALAQTQIHRLMAVDGQAVLLDAESDLKQRPLLVVLHGLGEDAGEIRRQTGFTALAALDGFDVVYPNAPQDPADPIHLTAVSASLTPSASPETSATPPAPTSSPSPSPSPTRSLLPTQTVAPKPSRSVTVAPTSQAPRPSPSPSPSPTKASPSRPAQKSKPPRPRPKKKPRPSPLVPGTRAWNAGTCCAVPTRNDVGYLVDVVSSVEGTVPVDTSRVYIVGFSNGGMMALDAICSAPTVFAAAGSVSGPFLGTACARPIWRHIAAAADEVVPPAGGVPAGLPELGVVRDWCGCSFPATTTEAARYGYFASVLISPTGGHTWPTPTSSNWAFDPEHDLWDYVSKFHF